MPLLETKFFGQISYESDAVLEFPGGLPGFEDRREFVVVQMPDAAPLVFLQSLEDRSLCFTTMPVQAVDRDFRLAVSAEDLERLGLPAGRQPRIGRDVLCLTVLSIKETGPTANLLAPVVVNLANRRAVQAVALESDYSCQHGLFPLETAACS
jgi:flagellar assembly factor FliW